jgi:hypothetical protein
MHMAKLVSSATEATANIHRYNEQIDGFRDLLPFNRAWYAIKKGKGWLFGPSKFIGYVDMTAEEYLGRSYNTDRRARVSPRHRDENPLDGRITEGVLAEWSQLIEKGHPDYDQLRTALNELCGRYSKKPNRLARISIIGTDASSIDAPALDDEIVALLAAVFRKLTPAHQTAFRNRIKK